MIDERRIGAVIAKEWLDLFRNKVLVASMVVLPLVMVGSVVGMSASVAYFEAREAREAREAEATLGADDRRALELKREQDAREARAILSPQLAALGEKDGLLVQLTDMMLFMILLVPMVLPTYAAAHSVIGEKETRSLEPLLATPLRTSELLLGKALAVVVPAVALGWLSYAVAAAGLFCTSSPVVFAHAVRPAWTLGILLLGPLLAVLATLTGVVVSARVTDPRVAQQVAGLIILPLVGLSSSAMLGWVFMDVGTLTWAVAIAAALSLALLGASVRLFQRETILTRWR